MTKTLLLLALALAFEASGVALLSRGAKLVGEPAALLPGPLLAFAGRAARCPTLLAGVALQAVFFVLYLVVLSRGELSFVAPLAALGLVLTTLMAWGALGETVPARRWAGVLLIVAGSACVVSTGRAAPPGQPAVAATPAAPGR